MRSDNGDYRKTIWLKVFPRQISLGFLESILTQGIPMDVSLQVSQVPSAQALSNLQSQLTKMQASANLQLKRKGIVDEKEKIAMEDIVRLRSQVMRGVERMFNVCLAVTVHAPSERKLEEYLTVLRSVFTSVMAQVEELPRVQAKALRMTMPLCENPMRHWTVVDTSSVALLYPFGPPDMDARDGTLIGLDTNARSLVTFDKFNSPVGAESEHGDPRDEAGPARVTARSWAFFASLREASELTSSILRGSMSIRRLRRGAEC